MRWPFPSRTRSLLVVHNHHHTLFLVSQNRVHDTPDTALFDTGVIGGASLTLLVAEAWPHTPSVQHHGQKLQDSRQLVQQTDDERVTLGSSQAGLSCSWSRARYVQPVDLIPSQCSHQPDPELSTAKRKLKTQAFTSQMNYAALQRQLGAVQTDKSELESKLRDKEACQTSSKDYRPTFEQSKC